MEDERSITGIAEDSPLIRRQILICLLRLLLRPEADLRPMGVGRNSPAKYACDRALKKGAGLSLDR